MTRVLCLQLPPLATGDIATITVDQPDFAPIRIKDVRLEDKSLVEVAMSPGVKLTFRVDPPGLLSSFDLDLNHEPFSHPSTVINQIPASPDGTTSLTVEPGQYSFLRLNHEDYFITPELQKRLQEAVGHPPAQARTGPNFQCLSASEGQREGAGS
jgi:hypothetical protein